MAGPFDPCAQCDHHRLYHEGGKCKFPGVDVEGKKTECSCPAFVEPKKNS